MKYNKRKPARMNFTPQTVEQLSELGPDAKLRIVFHRCYRHAKQLKADTVNLEAYVLRQFGKYLKRPATLRDLTPKAIGDFKAWILAKGLKLSTADSYSRSINRLRRWCIKVGLVDPPAVATEVVTYSTHKTCRSFRENIDRVRAQGDKPPACLMDAAIAMADERSLAKGHTRNLIGIATEFEAFHGRVEDFGKLTEAMVNRWIVALVEAGKLSDASINRKRGDVLSIWNYLADRELCKYPMARRVKRLKPEPQIPRSITRADVLHLLESCRNVAGIFEPHGQQKARVLLAWIHVAWDGALRPWCDQLRLRRDAIQDNGICTLIQSKTHHPHTFRLRPATLEAIDAIRPKDTERVFPVGYRQMNRVWRELCHVAKLDIPPKMLRSARATDAELQERGAAGQVLGHKPGSAVAYKHYVDPLIANSNPPLPPELEN